MSDQPTLESKSANPLELLSLAARVAIQFQRVARAQLERQLNKTKADFNLLDVGSIARSFQTAGLEMVSEPGKLVSSQLRFWQDYGRLWQNAMLRMMGQTVEPVISPVPPDKRFKGEAWQSNLLFDLIKQAYLLVSRQALEAVRNIDGLDAVTAKKVRFYTRQLVDAMAPSNFVLTNPEVLRLTVRSGGVNLLRGLSNLLADLERGQGKLRIRMTDEDRFSLGENVAATPGKVIYQNDLMQLLQYTPSTASVYKRPVLIIPPWINKYYILDLRPGNSFIKWMVDKGHTVFVISWVNPDGSLADKSFDDYMIEGPLAALDAIEVATGEREMNVIGYCLGGTLLAATLAWMKRKRDKRIKAATFLVTLTDFREPGDLGVFIDEDQIARIEHDMEGKGYFDGGHMFDAFNMLRENDLIWTFVVNNYLKGRTPAPFDLLYWNSDSTNLPRAMHSFYLRKMYLENLLCKPDGLRVAGVPIDLTSVDTPAYILSTREDHIAPWASTYAATRLYSGPVRFVLGMSGHIAGVINPPANMKYGYWTNRKLPSDPQAWLSGAEPHKGSWWLDWQRWIARYHGRKVAPRVPGDGALPVLEDAPGSYVKVRIN